MLCQEPGGPETAGLGVQAERSLAKATLVTLTPASPALPRPGTRRLSEGAGPVNTAEEG